MGFFEDIGGKAVSWVTNPIGTGINTVAPGFGNYQGAVPGQVTSIGDKYVQRMAGMTPDVSSGVPRYTPEQQRQMRQVDMDSGQERFRKTVSEDEGMKGIMDRYKQMSYGYNSQQAQGLRDQMIQGQQGANQAQLRQLLSRQGSMGVAGPRATAQQIMLMKDQGLNRANAERDLLIRNYEAEKQGLADYANKYGQLKFGEIASGLGEAGLGVSDRTGSTQAAVGDAMAKAARDGGKK